MSPRAVAAAAVLALGLFSDAPAQDGTWRDFMPPMRRGAALVHDTFRDRYVMFGGLDGQPSDEVWMLHADSTQWRQLTPGGSRVPQARSGAASVYDVLHDRIWFYGGTTVTGATSGLWGLDADPEEWLLFNPGTTSAGTRTHASLVHDVENDRLYLFGGQISTVLLTATNEVFWVSPYSDDPKWNKVQYFGTAPTARWDAIVAIDRLRDRLIVIGGRNRDSVFTDAWQLSLSQPMTWSRIVTVGETPPPRAGALGALDAANDRIVTFGGMDPETGLQYQDVWTFALSGLDTWEHVDAADPPDALLEACAVIDTSRSRVVIHGGGRPANLAASYFSNETRTLDVSGTPSWGRITPRAPSPRYGAGSALDLAHDSFWIFGGLTSKSGANTYSSEVWRGSLSQPGTWSLLLPEGPGPAGRHEPALAYDARANRLYAFGGWNGSDYFGDTWTLDPVGAWRPVATGGGPTPRRAHATAWDASRRALFVYGGTDGTTTFGDAWELSTEGTIAWRRIEAEGPVPRAWASAVYDPAGDRMILYGGMVEGTTQNEVWALSLGGTPHWARLAPTGTAPEPRARHAAAYDPARRRMLVWGGFTDDNAVLSSLPGTWALALDGDPVWSKLGASGPEPSPAVGPAMVYDLRRDRMVTYGGSDLFDDLLPDLRALEFGGAGNGNEAWLEGARVEGTSVRIAWQTLAAAGTGVTIEKRVDAYGDELRTPFDRPEGVWGTAITMVVAADGSVSWTDTHVGSGGSYSYRLVIGGLDSDVASIDVPVTAKFALEGVLPSPTTGPLVLAIRSSGASPVFVSLHDVNGRRVLVRELGVLPAGLQSVPFELPATRRAGVYFVRVTQGGSADSRKIVVL